MSGVAEKWAEEQLAKIEKEIESKTGDLIAQRDELAGELKRLRRGKGTNNGTPPIPEADIIQAIADITSGDKETASSSEIAKQLGNIDVRKIARKLAKMGEDSISITGDKTSGYSLV